MNRSPPPSPIPATTPDRITQWLLMDIGCYSALVVGIPNPNA